jgi:hypothetical protein
LGLASGEKQIPQINENIGNQIVDGANREGSGSLQAGAQRRSKRKVPKIICSTRIEASERRKQARFQP